MEIFAKKLANGALVPASDADHDKLTKIKANAIVRCEITQPRNVGFHRKFFVLVKLLFGIWEEACQPMKYRGIQVLPNIDKFRRDLTILAGRYTATYNLHGEVQLEAKSISFANMGQDEYEGLFSDVINVALRRVINRSDWTEEKIREACDEILRFDS